MNYIKITLILIFFTSCSSNYFISHRQKYADNLAARAELEKSIIKTKEFYLTTFSKIKNPKNHILSVYIEGDGLSWKNKFTPSNNPTPTNPIALKMAISDKSPNILYIARPCQYTSFELDKNCQVKFWTNARFADIVIKSTNEAITKFVRQYGFKKINLYGYSGGGAVAMLVAARRDDVKYIATIAANLDHQQLTKIHNVTSMNESLSPINYIIQTKNIPQLHIAGTKDKIVPPAVICSFVDKVNAKGGKASFKLMDATHEYEYWPEVWDEIINKKP